MKQIKIILISIAVLSLLFVGTATAWEPPEDFDWETPYNIEANCGGGCEVQFGIDWLEQEPSQGENKKEP